MASFLTEVSGYDESGIILEASDSTNGFGEKKKHYYMQGIFIQAEIKNKNGRVYPANQIRKAVEAIQQRIETGESVVGEADHPDDLDINIDRISHVIERMWMDGNNGMGRLRILSEQPCGKIVEGLLKEGIKLGVSSRGQGDVDEFTGKVSNFQILTVDVVVNPSAHNAYPVPLYESIFNSRNGRRLVDLSKHAIAGDNLAERYMESEIRKFIESLKP